VNNIFEKECRVLLVFPRHNLAMYDILYIICINLSIFMVIFDKKS